MHDRQGWSEREIRSYVEDYAIFHNVETSEVIIDRIYEGRRIIGFRLSLDVGGDSQGVDESYGNCPID
jgi:hypothetical protein